MWGKMWGRVERRGVGHQHGQQRHDVLRQPRHHRGEDERRRSMAPPSEWCRQEQSPSQRTKEGAAAAWGRLACARAEVPAGSDAEEAATAAFAALGLRARAAGDFDGAKKFEEGSTDADVTGWLAESFPQCAGLTTVDLSRCDKLTDAGIANFGRRCTRLTKIELRLEQLRAI